MLNYLKIMVLLTSYALICTSCQSGGDEPPLIDEPSNSLTSNDFLVKQLIDVTLSKGFEDDILDNFSHAKVKLPVDVSVNEQFFTVGSKNDFPIIEAVINFSSTDTDLIVFDYPITLKFNDYSERIADNENDFNLIKQEFVNHTANMGISCLKIRYPIGLTFFNSVSGDAGGITIEAEERFFKVLSNLLDSDIIEINYPISVLVGDEISNTTISNNEELLNAINDAPLNCNTNNTQTGACQITICHFLPDNPDNIQQMVVGCDALPEHLQHGDIIGPCS